MVADVEELDNLEASQVHARRLDAKDGDTFFSLSQMEQSSWSGEIRHSEDPSQFRITLHEARSTMMFSRRVGWVSTLRPTSR